jgi:hypothetical protein
MRIGFTWDGEALPDEQIAEVSFRDGGDELIVDVDAPFHGDPPPTGAPGPTEKLWEHEAVEVFVAGPHDRYLEIEMGPHGHHLVIQLDGVRRPVASGLSMTYSARIAGLRWRGEARIPRAWLPEKPHRVNAYAVHGVSERHHHAATPVPGAKPDFHQPDRFAEMVLP